MHTPAWHVSVCVHLSPSLHEAPFVLFGFEHAPVCGLHVPTSWHASDALHETGLAPVHTPAWHVSVCVQRLPSLHAAPFALFGFEHAPVCGSHVPTTWHWSEALHVTGLAPVHTPAWHVSVCVHALPSLHEAPLALFGFEHTPDTGLQTPTS